MADSKIVVANGVYDLSEVKNAQQLHEEINMLKAAVKKDEQFLLLHFRKFPEEALKSTADAVLPSFINKMIANRSWKVITAGAGLLANPFSKKLSFTKNILGGARKLGMLAAAKGAYSLWKNKKADKPAIKHPVVQQPKPIISPIK